jgi:DNA-binding NarL/FixJ family response regulator
MKPWRSVLVVDDHEFYARGLAHMLEARGVVALEQVTTGAEAVESALCLAPDVVIMDLELPGFDGLEATRRIRREAGDQAILGLTGESSTSTVVDAIVAGMSGVVPKYAPADEIMRGVDVVVMGGRFLSESATALVMEYIHATTRAATPGTISRDLTARELEVLVCLAEGCGNGEIAQRLMISAHTVKTHVSTLLAKLGASNRVQAVVHAYRERLLPELDGQPTAEEPVPEFGPNSTAAARTGDGEPVALRGK